VVRILLCKHCKFGETIFYNSKDIQSFLVGYFVMARPVAYCDLLSWSSPGTPWHDRESKLNLDALGLCPETKQ